MHQQAHPRMVAVVREAMGLSQSSLAQAAGLSQGYISKVESGLLSLNGDNLTHVATILDCPIELLVDETPIQGMEVTCLHHRRRGSKINVGTQRRIEALTHLTRVSVEGLLHGIELVPDTDLRDLDLDRHNDDPAAAAQAVRAAWKLDPGPIRNVIEVIERSGVIVIVRSMATQAQDGVSTWPKESGRPAIMVLRQGLPGDRQRFTAAHELGHLVMHSLPNEDQEKQADSFASEFLAPAADIAPALAGLNTGDFPKLIRLKSEWGMSIAALIRRAYDLDAISERQYRQFQIRINQLGWRQIEPGDVPVENPTTLDRVMTALITQRKQTTTELATAARMLPEAFTEHYRPPRTTEPPTPIRLTSQ